jgi:hypothetical protein
MMGVAVLWGMFHALMRYAHVQKTRKNKHEGRDVFNE